MKPVWSVDTKLSQKYKLYIRKESIYHLVTQKFINVCVHLYSEKLIYLFKEIASLCLCYLVHFHFIMQILPVIM